ncbi:hypothetical protein HG537_0C06200 [Torulaspora globosa]|uniref:Endoplasmic reticulum junction formation protein lunapark n=1 Tax=Torulaspora globosa TaxID=48254 RepID=A0A7H9HRR3_9SACH|nr:hypothetical protein HG537_0C06200 [Torulaspora sp. CBS 2947]
MLSTIRNWGSGNRRTLVQRYTDELSQITGEIHELDRRLKSSQQAMDNLQSMLTYNGSGVVVAVFAYLYWVWDGQWFRIAVGVAGCIAIMAVVKYTAYRSGQWNRNRQSRKLAKLRALHQEKLEKLKEETNYHATSSIIQRFSQGEEQSEDAMILMDEELRDKYRELNDLKEELAQFKQEDKLKDKKERDKWFDKVINALAGGDTVNKMFLPITCPKCQAQTGVYRLGNLAFRYVCPVCGYAVDTSNKTVEERST